MEFIMEYLVNLREESHSQSEELLEFYADQLEPYPGLNVRDWESLVMQRRVEQLADSIVSNNGISDPIVVLAGPIDEDGTKHIYVTSGETRLRAARLLLAQNRVEGRGPIFHALYAQAKTEIDRTIDLYVDNDHLNFSSLELIELFRRLEEFGLTQQQIADRLGQKLHFVTNLWPLMKAGDELRELLRNGVVATTVVCQAIISYGADEAINIVRQRIGEDRVRKEVELEEAQRVLSEKEIAFVNDTQDDPPVKRSRGRPRLSKTQRELKVAQRGVSNATAALARNKVPSTVILPDKDWRKHVNVTKLLVALRYIAQWTNEESTFNQINTVLVSVGEPKVNSHVLLELNDEVVDGTISIDELKAA
jgi:hypothetical protein